MERTKKCKVCENDFIAKSDKAEYCSNACRASAHRRRKKHKTEYEYNQQLQSDSDDFDSLEERVSGIEENQYAMVKEWFESIQEIAKKVGSYISTDTFYKNNKEIRNSIDELSKPIETLKVENRNIQNDIHKIKGNITDLVHEIKFLKEDINRNNLLNSEKNMVHRFAGIAENILSNEQFINKISNMIPEIKQEKAL